MNYKRPVRSGVFYKKANTSLDLILGVVFFFLVAIGGIFAFKILSDINTEIQAEPDLSATAKASSQQLTNNFPKFMDNAMLIFVVLFWVFILVSSFFIDTYPVFFIISFVLLLIVFVIAMMISNTFEDVVSDDGLRTFADEFPKTSWIMGNLLILVMVIGVSSALALYANSGGGVI